MQPKKKLKVIPIHRFFQNMDRLSKGLFLILFIALVGYAVGSVMAVEDPVRWSIEVNEYNSATEQEVIIRDYEEGYRQMSTEIGAWKEDVSLVATPIIPQVNIVLLFIIGQILGWGFMLTAATYVKSWFTYIVYFAFALTIFLSSAFESVAPDNYWPFNIGLAVLLFAPAYLLQQSVIQLRFAFRLLIFLVVAALPFFLQYQFAGWQGLHNSTVGMYPILCLILIVYTFFVSTDISNLMFFLATNAKNRKYRMKFPVIFGVFMVIIALEFLLLQQQLGWDLLNIGNEVPLRPIYLLAFAAVVMVGTKQSLFPILKTVITNRAMSMGLAGLGVVAMSTLFFHAAVGEFLFVFMIERVITIFFFLATLFHFFYIYYNFEVLISARLNFYFLSMMPKRLMYFFVVVATALLGFALEASDHGKTKILFSATLYSRLADQAFLSGNNAEAIALYSTAVGVAGGTVKANYNLAMLALVLENKEKARDHFQKARKFKPFPYAALNEANLEVDNFSLPQAKYILRRNQAQIKHPSVANNLALLYLAEGKPDSAILQLKMALEIEPNNSALYANLGSIYTEYEKPEWATKFYELGLEADAPSAALLTNALFHNLKYGTNIAITDSLINLSKRLKATRYNYALDKYKKREYSKAKEITDTIMKIHTTPDVLLLDGMLLFEQGKIAEAISRMAYINETFPSFRRYTDHYLAVSFFAAGVPEMAGLFFQKSVDNGRKDDLINAALMQIDCGNQARAFQLLGAARLQDSTLFEQVNKEIAMLQMSYGEYFMASIGFDMGSMTADEWARTGRYAGSSGNLGAALEAFRRLIALDSTSIVPYLEMGRISLALGDSLVLENIAPGLERAPNHPVLRTLKARALLRNGDRTQALQLARTLKAEMPDDVGVGLLEAELSVASRDTNEAIKVLNNLHQKHPLNQEVVLSLSKLYRATRQDFVGQNMIYDALDINPQNPDFWTEMAYFEQLLGRKEPCGSSAIQALRLYTDPEKIAVIEVQFESEIAQLSTETEE